MNIPIELCREIVSYILAAPENDATTGSCHKAQWKYVNGLSMSSKTFRTLLLEQWFSILHVTAPSQLHETISLFPEITRWTRELYCLIQGDRPCWHIEPFYRVSKLCLRWTGDSTEDVDQSPVFSTPLPSITELELLGLKWPSPLALRSLTESFPKLRTLRLSQRYIWCPLCNVCTISGFQQLVSDKIVYTGGLGLPMHYNWAFSQLTQLSAVHISIAYLRKPHYFTALSVSNNPFLWAGECNSCMFMMYDDGAFKDEWVKRKKGWTNDIKFSTRPPALQRVYWEFQETDEEDEEEPYEADVNSP